MVQTIKVSPVQFPFPRSCIVYLFGVKAAVKRPCNCRYLELDIPLLFEHDIPATLSDFLPK